MFTCIKEVFAAIKTFPLLEMCSSNELTMLIKKIAKLNKNEIWKVNIEKGSLKANLNSKEKESLMNIDFTLFF